MKENSVKVKGKGKVKKFKYLGYLYADSVINGGQKEHEK